MPIHNCDHFRVQGRWLEFLYSWYIDGFNINKMENRKFTHLIGFHSKFMASPIIPLSRGTGLSPITPPAPFSAQLHNYSSKHSRSSSYDWRTSKKGLFDVLHTKHSIAIVEHLELGSINNTTYNYSAFVVLIVFVVFKSHFDYGKTLKLPAMTEKCWEMLGKLLSWLE